MVHFSNFNFSFLSNWKWIQFQITWAKRWNLNQTFCLQTHSILLENEPFCECNICCLFLCIYINKTKFCHEDLKRSPAVFLMMLWIHILGKLYLKNISSNNTITFVRLLCCETLNEFERININGYKIQTKFGVLSYLIF